MKSNLMICFALLFASFAVAAANPQVEVKTNLGDFKIELLQKDAPISVANFLKYVDAKKYDGTIFHRVIDGFMIQGGGFNDKMEQLDSYAPIKNEAANGLTNTIGTVAMARTQVIDSATNQFFINVADNDFLNHRSKDENGYGYAVFGRVVQGMPVVNQIKKVATLTKGMYQNVPEKPVVILSIRRTP